MNDFSILDIQTKSITLVTTYEHLYKKEVILIVDALERSGRFSFPGNTRRSIEKAMIKYLGSTDSIGG